ncbi:hypothetical protein ACFFLM_19160 [Deinococcus oregonensis]|uniref:Head-to-tail connector protein n=1 Tax=Deinococcus oregonensis TaxID=1805970 RepID=A0ABV6B2U2_9DEIO
MTPHKVKKSFVDRNSGERVAVDDVIDVTDERAAELDGYVTPVKKGGKNAQSSDGPSGKRADSGSTGDS